MKSPDLSRPGNVLCAGVVISPQRPDQGTAGLRCPQQVRDLQVLSQRKVNNGNLLLWYTDLRLLQKNLLDMIRNRFLIAALFSVMTDAAFSNVRIVSLQGTVLFVIGQPGPLPGGTP
jgi:hypothetical protein